MKISKVLDGVMASFSAEVICLVIFICNLGFGDAIMCVRCNSKGGDASRDPCEKEPPTPVACMGSTNINKYCAVTRQYKEDGTLMQINRDCSTVEKEECSLTGRAEPYRVCVSTCGLDGCNSAPASHLISTFTLISGLITAILLQRRAGC